MTLDVYRPDITLPPAWRCLYSLWGAHREWNRAVEATREDLDMGKKDHALGEAQTVRVNTQRRACLVRQMRGKDRGKWGLGGLEKRRSHLGPTHQPPPGGPGYRPNHLSGCQGDQAPPLGRLCFAAVPGFARALHPTLTAKETQPRGLQPVSPARHPLSGCAPTAHPGCQGDGPARRRPHPERLSPPPASKAS